MWGFDMNFSKYKRAYGVLLLFWALCLVAAPVWAQKDKKKKTGSGPIPMSVRVAEAERSFTEGEKYFILEDYAKALYYFQKALELNVENTNDQAATHYKIAEILSKGTKQDDLLSASISIENAMALDKKNKYFYILASTIYSSLNNFALAEQTLETMMREIKGNDEYLYELAALYQYDHNPEEAIRVYNRAEALLGVNEISSLQKQKLYFESGRTTEAIAEGQKLIDSDSDDERYVLAFAETLSRNKQSAKAISTLEAFLKEHPDNGDAKMLLAGVYHEDGQENKFRELISAVFDDASVPVTDKVALLSTQIMMLSKAPRKNDPAVTDNFSEQLFLKLVKQYPGDNTVHTVGGDLYMVLKNVDDAEKQYREAIHFGSTNFDAWQNLISLELEENQFDSIIVHTENGLELFPNQAILYYFNGYAQLRKKNYREAITSLLQAKKLSANNVAFTGDNINGMLGDAYNGAKDFVKSDKAYEDALAINPDNDGILNNYSYYLALRKENLEKADKMAARLIKNNPNNASYLDTYGWVLYMREKYKEAKKVLEKAVNQSNASAVMHEHYGDILFKLGNTDEAVKEWQKSKTLDSGNVEIDKKIANRRLY
jgi:tetratricopeptide (TPR) repeat protein